MCQAGGRAEEIRARALVCTMPSAKTPWTAQPRRHPASPPWRRQVLPGGLLSGLRAPAHTAPQPEHAQPSTTASLQVSDCHALKYQVGKLGPIVTLTKGPLSFSLITFTLICNVYPVRWKIRLCLLYKSESSIRPQSCQCLALSRSPKDQADKGTWVLALKPRPSLGRGEGAS